MTNEELIEHASALLRPHRGPGERLFGDVAAALLSEQGQLYTGVCIDTASWGLCAERSAVAAMVTAGEYRLRRIVAVWRDERNGRLSVLPRCGICREFMRQIDDANRYGHRSENPHGHQSIGRTPWWPADRDQTAMVLLAMDASGQSGAILGSSWLFDLSSDREVNLRTARQDDFCLFERQFQRQRGWVEAPGIPRMGGRRLAQKTPTSCRSSAASFRSAPGWAAAT